MTLSLLKIVFKIIRDQLNAEIEKIKAKLPDSYGQEKGTGTFLDPHTTVYPILDGLYSMLTTIDNIVFFVFLLEKENTNSRG